MKKVIWKYPMGIVTTYEMPDGAEFLDVQIQDGVACAWFLVDPSRCQAPRKFKIYGTGHPIPMRETYLGTYQSPPFVWHLFEDRS